MYGKKCAAFLPAAALTLGLLSGCGNFSADAVVPAAKSEGQAVSAFVKETVQEPPVLSQEEQRQLALENIAAGIGCSVEELNYVCDDEGRLTFLGHSFTDAVVSDAEEAAGVLTDAEILTDISAASLVFQREDVSPVTGCTYYTFQFDASAGDETDSDVRSVFKLIVDPAGKVQGFSASADYEPFSQYGGNAEESAADSSAEFFDTMVPAGEYTYTLDMTWAEQLGQGWVAGTTLEITVPVMRSTETGLYYLGDKDRCILTANAYDYFYDSYTLNPVVSSSPGNKGSWHFLFSEDSAGERYFFDSDYVLSAYWAGECAVRAYSDRWGLSDSELGSTLLTVYRTADSAYADTVEDFDVNCLYCGTLCGWETYSSSPAFAESAEPGTMAHELAHCIRSHMTDDIYLNGPGAVMEGSADVIGELLAWLSGCKEDEFLWEAASQYGNMCGRSFSEPYKYNCPDTLNGCYFVNPVTRVAALASGIADRGGVHRNAAILNHLCYLFSCTENAREEDRLTIGENLDLWFETLYCASPTASYAEQGAYLLFAAERCGLTTGKTDTIRSGMEQCGLTDPASNTSADAQENGYSHCLVFDFEDPDDLTRFSIAACGTDGAGSSYILGGTDASGVLTFRLPEGTSLEWSIVVCDEESGSVAGSLPLTQTEPDETKHITVRRLSAEVGQTLSDIGTIESFSYVYDDGSRSWEGSVNTEAGNLETEELRLDMPGFCLICVRNAENGETGLILVEVYA